MENDNQKTENLQFDPLGIFNLNIQSELYAKDLLNGESEVLKVNEQLTHLGDIDLTYTKTEDINKANIIQ